MSKELYNKKAEFYDRLINKLGYAESFRELISIIPLDIPKNPKIIDIGCGTGSVIESLRNRFPEAEIFGLDISEEMLKISQKRFQDVEFLLGDFNKDEIFISLRDKKSFNLKKSYFDLVISAGAVSEYGKPGKAIPFICGLIKKGGLFINIGTKKNIIGMITGKLWNFKPTSERRFVHACAIAGLHAESVRIPWGIIPMSFMRYVIKARKQEEAQGPFINERLLVQQ